MGDNGGLSASDVALMSNNGWGNDGMGIFWLFAILILAGGGLGNFGGNGYRPQYATQDFVQNGFNFNDLQNQNRDIVNAITSGTAQAVAATNQAKYDNINVMKDLIERQEKVYILTKAANEAAKLGKIDFLKKYIPEFDLNYFICIVGSGKKIDYIKEDGVLIDDDKKNLKQWEKAGQPVYFVEVKGQKVVF